MAVEYLEKAFKGDKNIPKTAYAPFYFVTKHPEVLPPGLDVVTPEEAWAKLYPNVKFGQVS